MDMAIQNELSCLIQETNRAKMVLTAIKFQSGSSPSVPGQYIGKPIPTRLFGRATVPRGSTQTRHQITIPVSSDGPFCAKTFEVMFGTRSLTLPVSIQWDTFFDFYWEYKITGSERDRQNEPVPSYLLSQHANRHVGEFELSPQDVFPKSSTVIVWLTFWQVLNHTYDIEIAAGFNGFYILG